ncbi:MAG: gliding motility-associated C-terminal domain-containing protein [Fimbriimonadaceae bacterium]|nr:gliding motility-associated C-terminal domain-containing protein [Chitinophagales bacterium]
MRRILHCCIFINFFFIDQLSAQVFALDDDPVINEDVSVFIDVQDNDLNLGAGSLYTFLISAPPNGTALVFDQDSIFYTPDLNFYGVDTFSYTIYNEDEIPSFASAQVVITVNPQPDFPLAQNDYDTTAIETPVTIDVQTNDLNFDPEFLTTVLITPPLNGTAEVLGGISILYTPSDDYSGDDILQYAVCNSAATTFCDTATVFLHVIQTNFFYPVLENDSAVIPIGGSAAINVLANDTDGDGDFLYVDDLLYSSLSGSIAINLDFSVQYTAGEPGTDIIYYIGCDFNTPRYCDTATLKVTVPVTLYYELNIPNSFSPNGDGINDYFLIEGLEIYSSFNLKIFNRWGDLVFETTDKSILWDGKAYGQVALPEGKLPDGTYFYVLQPENSLTLYGYIEMRR